MDKVGISSTMHVLSILKIKLYILYNCKPILQAKDSALDINSTLLVYTSGHQTFKCLFETDALHSPPLFL
jgi:hypothetical protein